MARLKDIAEQAGVSVQVVSTILNKSRSTTGASQATRQKVMRVAQEMGYVVNAQAASLATGHSKTIGLICPTLDDPHLFHAVKAAEQTCHDHAYGLMVATSEKSPDWGAMIRRKQVDLLITVSLGTLELSRVDIPSPIQRHVVAIGPEHPQHLEMDNRQWGSQITWQDEHGGAMAAEYLLQQGCRHPAVMAGIDPGSARVVGFLDRIQQAGITTGIFTCTQEAEPDLAGATMFKQALQANPKIDGLFLRTDRFYPGLISVLLAHKTDNAQPIKLIGYGGLYPTLPSIHTPLDQAVRTTLETYFRHGTDALTDQRLKVNLPTEYETT